MVLTCTDSFFALSPRSPSSRDGKDVESRNTVPGWREAEMRNKRYRTGNNLRMLFCLLLFVFFFFFFMVTLYSFIAIHCNLDLSFVVVVFSRDKLHNTVQ